MYKNVIIRNNTKTKQKQNKTKNGIKQKYENNHVNNVKKNI